MVPVCAVGSVFVVRSFRSQRKQDFWWKMIYAGLFLIWLSMLGASVGSGILLHLRVADELMPAGSNRITAAMLFVVSGFEMIVGVSFVIYGVGVSWNR